MKKLGSLIVLSGPSGVGKSSLIKALLTAEPELKFSISCTTRAPRPGEVDHRDYHFLTVAEFEARLRAGAFVEHAAVHRNYYGTLRSEVLEPTRAGQDVLLDIDVQGARQIRAAAARDPELARSAEFLFIGPPSLAVLEARLRGRGTDDEPTIRLRLSNAEAELRAWCEYDYVIVNDRLEEAAAELIGLVRTLRLRAPRWRENPFGLTEGE